jgi:hypothetical protein
VTLEKPQLHETLLFQTVDTVLLLLLSNR